MTAPYYLHLFCLSTEDSSLSSVLQSCMSQVSSEKPQFRAISTCCVPSESYLVLFYCFFQLLGIKDSEGQYSIHG